MYNINYEHNKELMNKCKEIRDYSYLVYRIRYHQNCGRTLDDAIIIAIKDCIKNNVMLEYLLKHQSEVPEIMKIAWSHKGEIEYEREIARAEGKILGMDLLGKMYSWLSASKRNDELIKSFEDKVLRQKLLAEYEKLHPAAMSV